MKVSLTRLFRDVDYLARLNDYDKNWLYEFELMEKYSMTPIGCIQNLVQARLTRNQRTAYNSDVLNTTPEAILEHYYNRKLKPIYTWNDYPQIEDIIDLNLDVIIDTD